MNLRNLRIESKRLLLVPVTTEYAKKIFHEYREPMIQYMNYGAPESLEILEERIKAREDDMERGENLSLVVLLKESEEFIGRFALEDLDQKTPEMGGWLKQSAHGNGYGKEAAKALKEWADKNLDYEHIIWPCVAQNIPSRKLAEALGGEVSREYKKKTASGKVFLYLDYLLKKN